ncbi:MAG: hypothetical protein IRZ31_01820 [Thermogemmatispora sp.]|uniref:hypothetical protein n=1 Tax=Thermogemmatispora sp. TaxID=1968838 RepID=UPI002624E197|nr:hypothetical protein [Thermogemmatispora sp.]MBX5455611.1 hypothetical protein [Thermogemmatispora sp.]
MGEVKHSGSLSSHSIDAGTQSPRARKRIIRNCSVCTQRIPLEAIAVTEPEGAPEPRQSWVLCRDCYRALLAEMSRSPVRSPLRLRIALGLVAAERRPASASSAPHIRRFVHDHRAIMFIAWTLIIGMLLHLLLIVGLASLH